MHKVCNPAHTSKHTSHSDCSTLRLVKNHPSSSHYLVCTSHTLDWVPHTDSCGSHTKLNRVTVTLARVSRWACGYHTICVCQAQPIFNSARGETKSQRVRPSARAHTRTHSHTHTKTNATYLYCCITLYASLPTALASSINTTKKIPYSGFFLRGPNFCEIYE